MPNPEPETLDEIRAANQRFYDAFNTLDIAQGEYKHILPPPVTPGFGLWGSNGLPRKKPSDGASTPIP